MAETPEVAGALCLPCSLVGSWAAESMVRMTVYTVESVRERLLVEEE